jgi:hypothetical protein
MDCFKLILVSLQTQGTHLDIIWVSLLFRPFFKVLCKSVWLTRFFDLACRLQVAVVIELLGSLDLQLTTHVDPILHLLIHRVPPCWLKK